MSYLRHVLTLILGSIITVQKATGVSVVDFTAVDWLLVANSLWLALLPVAMRYFDKNDPAFGKVH